MSIIQELKRRNVIRVGIAYVVFGWVMLQGADFGLDLVGAPNWIIQALSIAVASGLPVALIVAWAFELTPEGIKRDRDVDRSQSAAAQTGRKLDRVIIGVLALAVLYLLVDRLLLEHLTDALNSGSAAPRELADSTPPVDPGPSVAVLPFVNMSGDRDNEYFSDGLTETLLHMLSQLPGLRVAARTSSFAFKGHNTSIGEIASALGVAHVLEGSVQKANDRVRVTAQLIRADDGFHVWSQSYTRPLEDIFAIQDEIATDVADALGSSLLGTAHPDLQGVSTTDIAAYDSYLKGLEQQALYSYSSLGDAENHFKQAIARDPGFNEARLSLVRNYLLKFSTGLIGEDETHELVNPLISQARELEPQNPRARALELTLNLMAFDLPVSAQEVESKVEELLGLLQVLPTESFTRNVVAQALDNFFGNEQQAIDVLQVGLMIDPLEAELHRTLGLIYIKAGRLDEARASLQRNLELAPGNPNSYVAMSNLEKEADNLPAALEWLRQASEVDSQDHELAAMIARDLYSLGLPEEGDYWLARVRALAPGSGLASSLQVERAAARDEPQEVIALATHVITEQVDARQNAFGRSLFLYVDEMLNAGRAREGYDLLASVRPEITHYDKIASDMQGLIMQWGSIGLMSGFESFENRKAAWDQFTGELDDLGFPWKTHPSDGNYTWDYLFNGDVEQAIDHYLEYEITEPLARNLTRHQKPLSAIFAPVYDDPRVAAKLNEDAQHFTEVREQVRAMLRQPEWRSGSASDAWPKSQELSPGRKES